LKIVNQDKKLNILETPTMKPRSKDSGVSQRRIPWFAIAIALTVTVSGFGRFAVAQQPSPRAPQSGNDAASANATLLTMRNHFRTN